MRELVRGARRPAALHSRIAIVVAVALLTACSDDGDSSSPTNPASGTVAVSPTIDPAIDAGGSSTVTDPATIDATDPIPVTEPGLEGEESNNECLVTIDDVTAALPVDTKPVVVDRIELEDSSVCTFSWTKFKQGTLQVTDYPGTAATLEATNPKRDDAIDVSGLGDRAYATGLERSVSLAVFKGDSAVVVDITQFPPEQNIAPRLDEWQGDALSAATALAAIAVGHL